MRSQFGKRAKDAPDHLGELLRVDGFAGNSGASGRRVRMCSQTCGQAKSTAGMRSAGDCKTCLASYLCSCFMTNPAAARRRCSRTGTDGRRQASVVPWLTVGRCPRACAWILQERGRDLGKGVFSRVFHLLLRERPLFIGYRKTTPQRCFLEFSPEVSRRSFRGFRRGFLPARVSGFLRFRPRRASQSASTVTV
jgi:hypothetical protein